MNVRLLFVSNLQRPELIQPSESSSTTQRQRPSPLPCSVLRFARKGMMRLSRRPCRIDSSS
jgi:hypothetical protein